MILYNSVLNNNGNENNHLENRCCSKRAKHAKQTIARSTAAVHNTHSQRLCYYTSLPSRPMPRSCRSSEALGASTEGAWQPPLTAISLRYFDGHLLPRMYVFSYLFFYLLCVVIFCPFFSSFSASIDIREGFAAARCLGRLQHFSSITPRGDDVEQL